MPKRKKSKNKKKPEKPQIQEMSGYTLGQHIYCNRYPDDVLSCGPITQLHKTPSDEFVTFIDEISGQYRISLLKDIIDSPTQKQIMATQSRMRSYERQMQRIEEKRKLKKKGRR